MASKQAIAQVLTTISANYGKHPKWRDEVASTWISGLHLYGDRDVLAAVKRWSNAESRTPTIANIRGTIKGMIGEIETAPRGCRRCSGSGWVEVAHHKGARPGAGKASVITYLAGCDCNAGSLLCQGSAEHWESFVAALRRDPYTIEVYYSTPDAPFLTAAERYSPETLDRIAPTLTDKRIETTWQNAE